MAQLNISISDLDRPLEPDTTVVPASSAVTPAEEIGDIVALQRVEIEWWSGQESMQTIADLEREIAEGRAVEVEGVGKWYKISANVPGEFRVLEKRTAALLEEVANAWGGRLQQLEMATAGGTFDKDEGNPFLVISSLGRTEEYQRELQKLGFPTVGEKLSTHTKLGAFDIGIKWFADNRPDLLKVLIEVLDAMRSQNRINRIEETQIGAMHVALNPTSQ